MQTLIYGTADEVSDTLRAVLCRRGHTVTVHCDADAAFEAFAGELPRMVVLADVTDASLAFCRRLRASDEVQPVVVAVFDEASRERLQDVFEAGADDCVAGTSSTDRLNTRFAFVEHRMADQAINDAAYVSRLQARTQQQAVVAEIGRRALADPDLDVLVNYAVHAVADALAVAVCDVLEHHLDDGAFTLRAGVGARIPYLGSPVGGDGPDTQAGYTLRTGQPILVEDYAAEQRFAAPDGLRDAGVVSGLTVVVTGAGRPWGVLGAYATEQRSFSWDDIHFLRSVANVLAGAIERARAEQALRESEARARAILGTTVDGVITIDAHGHIESVNPAAESIFGYDEDEILGENVKLLMPDPYRAEHDVYLRSYRATGRCRIIGVGREVTGLRKDGSTFPMDLAVSEVDLGDRVVFTGIVRDITERRRLEREILDITEQERRRIGQDLHDGLGQMLTGLGLLSQNLARQLNQQGVEQAGDAAEITELLKEADQYARDLARGLTPVDLEASGLGKALQRLSDNAERLFGLDAAFDMVGDPLVHNSTAATHMYRIAQEAVSNAVRHGSAHAIHIALAEGPGQIRLRVKDDGEGFRPGEHDGPGMGMRIMNYRARIIGGALEVTSRPGTGTTITCTIPLTAYATDGDEALAET